MAGRSWAAHFGRGGPAKGSDDKPRAQDRALGPAQDPAKSASIFDLVRQWQIVVTLIAAATGLWFAAWRSGTRSA